MLIQFDSVQMTSSRNLGIIFLSSFPYLNRTKARLGGDGQTALAVKRDEKWVRWSYSEYLSETEAAARAFIKLGLEPRHGVAIIGK